MRVCIIALLHCRPIMPLARKKSKKCRQRDMYRRNPCHLLRRYGFGFAHHH
jgi:hypothetical protein